MVSILSNAGVMVTSNRPSFTCFSSLHHYSISARGAINNISTPISATRRSGNYKPTLWDFQFIQSLHNPYEGDKHMKRLNKLKKEVKKMMMTVEGSHDEELEKLELIDNLERLGVSYHFKDEIMQILRSINININIAPPDSLYTTALKFRLLRQHGFHISQDILNDFKDENGNLKQSICKDTKDILNSSKDERDNLKQSTCNNTEGLLKLYEASFLSIENESFLRNTTKSTLAHLMRYVDQNRCGEENNMIVELVVHALELPRHWMVPRLETRWYISIYERMSNANPLLLELAKLDFNIVQATHQQDLRILSRWWKNTGLAEKLPFSRDILVENMFWAVGALFEPQHSYFRRLITKVIVFISIIDDIYDVYGTLDELELFTLAIQRWDTKAMEQLPDYMKVCYHALINIINEVAYEVLKNHDINVLPYLTKSWADLCKSYLQEAKWYHNGYKPNLEEYMDNARISIGVPMVLVHSLFLVTNQITKEALDSLTNYPDIIRWSATIFRLNDDLGTSSDELKRGDVSKSIQCYMNEKGASEEEAIEHIEFLIQETWEAMNTAQSKNSPLSETFIEVAKNITKTSHFMYLHSDVKSSISKILFEPIVISNVAFALK